MTDGAGSHPAEDEKRMNGHEPGAVNGFEPTGTIKEMAFDVLTRTPTGMTTAEVRAAIMTRFGVEVHDPSLPPQLARLKRRGQLTKEGKIWRVTQ
ncbi:MAG TPA: hypothetical protein VGO70_05840 [Arsenicitalea sp.]|nr:hypothetical protein [Arsenicitalea sp.]